MPVALEIQRFLDIRSAVVVAIDVLLWRRLHRDRVVENDDRALRELLFTARNQTWSTGEFETTSLRVETFLHQAVQYNRDGDELDASTLRFSVRDVDDGAELSSPEYSSGAMHELIARVDVAEVDALRDELLRRVTDHLPAPRWCIHPALPPAWLERANQYGLASDSMRIDWSNVNAVGLWHRERTGRFVVRYSADRVACCVAGPRPEPNETPVEAQHTLAHAPDMTAIATAVANVWFGGVPAALDEEGAWTRDVAAIVPETMSVEYFEFPNIASVFHWRRVRCGESWHVSSSTGETAPQRLHELAWFDERHRFHGFVRLVVWNNGISLATRFSGQQRDAVDAAVRAVVGAPRG